MDAGSWTLDELTALVELVLASGEGDDAGYPGAPNGRVRNVPDRRAVRWYTTIGLVDRPLPSAGRAARYGPRHLCQIIAVKRLQAAGRSLAEIQADLAGASDATLTAIAQVPDPLPVPGPAAPDRGVAASVTAARPRDTRFWAELPVASGDQRPAGDAHAGDGTAGDGATEVPLMTGVPLPGGAMLLLPAAPDADDLPAITAAARPLLDVLAARRLLKTTGRCHPVPKES